MREKCPVCASTEQLWTKAGRPDYKRCTHCLVDELTDEVYVLKEQNKRMFTMLADIRDFFKGQYSIPDYHWVRKNLNALIEEILRESGWPSES